MNVPCKNVAGLDSEDFRGIRQCIDHFLEKNVDAIFTVTDEQLIDSMRFYAERMKLVVEPTGCLSLAAALQMSPQLRGKKVGVIISGGNVDAQRYAQLLSMASSNT